MARGYAVDEIKEKIIELLRDAKTGLSGVEISDKLGINRITITKYLNVFAAEGLVLQKDVGNVHLWFVEEGMEQFQFPDDYFKIKTKYLDFLVEGAENQIYNLIRNCLHSSATVSKIVIEVILPSVKSIRQLYDQGKIGTAEVHFLEGIISNSIQILNLNHADAEPGKNVILLSADSQNSLLAEAAAASFRSEQWKIFSLRDMSNAIDVLFDLDIQKFLSKIWKQKGVMIIVAFSESEEGLRFFSEAITSAKGKIRKKLYIVLSGKLDKKTNLDADLVTENLDDILQWSQTVFESNLNK